MSNALYGFIVGSLITLLICSSLSNRYDIKTAQNYGVLFLFRVDRWTGKTWFRGCDSLYGWKLYPEVSSTPSSEKLSK